MKTDLTTLCVLSLLLSACGEKVEHSENAPVDAGTRNGILLTTELPPEELIGTPAPVILPLRAPM